MSDDDLCVLENHSIYILREAVRNVRDIAMLWSIGKDSTALVWLAKKAFLGRVPFPLVHIDTTYKIPAMIEHRDRLAREWELPLVIARNDEALADRRTYPNGRVTRVECCTALKSDALQQLLRARGYRGIIVGIRRDEQATRAKERYFSPRGAAMVWNAVDQPPELWDQFQTDVPAGGHLRIHPLLHWTELDVWRYIEREHIPVTPLYFADAHGRRYRSLGCAPCTAPIESRAASVADIVEELRATRIAERGGRAQDAESEDAFEALRRHGYM